MAAKKSSGPKAKSKSLKKKVALKPVKSLKKQPTAGWIEVF